MNWYPKYILTTEAERIEELEREVADLAEKLRNEGLRREKAEAAIRRSLIATNFDPSIAIPPKGDGDPEGLTLDAYQQKALRTAKRDGSTLQLAVLGLGIAGEAGEVADVLVSSYKHRPPKPLISKEVGDVLWYVSVLADWLHVSLRDLAISSLPELTEGQVFKDFDTYQQLTMRFGVYAEPEFRVTHLVAEACKVSDLIKKHVGHGHPLPVGKLIEGLGRVLRCSAALCCALDIELEGIATSNVQKLMERYPDGFNESASMARKDGGA